MNLNPVSHLLLFFVFWALGEGRPTLLRRSPLQIIEDVSQCSSPILPQLTLENWEYLREIQNAFQNYDISSEDRVNLLEDVIRSHRPETSQEEITAQAQYLFVLYTYTDFERTVISKRKDLADLGEHEIVFSALGSKNITQKINQIMRIANAVEQTQGRDAKKLMQKTLRVIVQLDEFFEIEQEEKLHLFSSTISCYLRHSA